MLNNSKILVELDKGGCKTMKQFTNDPGGHKLTNPGVGWHNEPGGGGWKHNQEPGTGWKMISDPGGGGWDISLDPGTGI